jgi:hypothetical protein
MADHDFQQLTSNQQETWTLFAVRFHDRAGCGELRAQLMVAHLEWAAAHREQVRVAGSLREAPGATPVGGLWVVRAPNREAVEALIASDPFTTGGLRERWEIYYWSKALPEPTTF